MLQLPPDAILLPEEDEKGKKLSSTAFRPPPLWETMRILTYIYLSKKQLKVHNKDTDKTRYIKNDLPNLKQFGTKGDWWSRQCAKCV